MATTMNIKKPSLELVSGTGTIGSIEAEFSGRYSIAEHWKSELEFFQDELQFLHTLVNKYFIQLIGSEHLDKTKKLVKKFGELEQGLNLLAERNSNYMEHIQELIENPFAHDAHQYREEHSELEKELIAFMKNFRIAKREAFRLTEQVIKSEKSKHLLQ
jgi:predicted nuclease with TOPRIM domain